MSHVGTVQDPDAFRGDISQSAGGAGALSLSLSLSLCAAARGVDVSEMGCFVGKRNTFFVSQLPFE